MKLRFPGPETFCTLLLMALAAMIALSMGGCKSSTQILLTDSTSVTAGSFLIGDVPVPSVSYQTGPRFYAATREDCDAGFWCKGSATITNTTSCLGIYDSTETKILTIEARGISSSTNAPAISAE